MRKIAVTLFVMSLLLIVAPASLAASISVSTGDLPSMEVEIRRPDFGPWATVNVFGISGKPSLGGDFDVVATALGGGIRYYLDGAANGGVYLGGYAGVYWLNGTYKNEDTLGRALVVSAASGYKWMLGGFFLDLGARLSFPATAEEDRSLYNAPKVFHDAFGTLIEVSVGYSF